MKRNTVALLVAALVIVAVVGGCKPSTTGTGAPATVQPIKVGAVIAVSGPSAPLGEPEKATLELLQDKLNKAGGINGTPVQIIIEDNESDAAKAQSAASKLIEQDKVVALLGGTASPDAYSMIPVAAKAGIPYISMAAGDKVSDPVTPVVFQTPPPIRLIAERVIRHVVDDLKAKSIAIIYDSNAFGAGGYADLKKLAPANKLNIVAAEAYDTKATDLTPQLTKIKAANPQVVISWGTNPGPAIAVKTMRELGMKQPFVGSHGIANMAFIDLAGQGKAPKDNPANGVVFPAGKVLIADKATLTPEQKAVMDAFIADYQAKTGKKPNTFAGHAYDAFGILTAAVKKVGANDPAKLRAAIEQTSGFVGIQGTFTYSPTNHSGLTLDDVTLIQIKDGQWQPYQAGK